MRKKAEAGRRLVGRGKDVNNLGGMNDYQARQAGINSTHLCKFFFSKVESTSQDKGKLTMSGEREL